MGISQKLHVREYIRHEVKVRQVVHCTFVLATYILQDMLLTLPPNVQKRYLKARKLLLVFGTNINPSYCSTYMTILLAELKLFQNYKEI